MRLQTVHLINIQLKQSERITDPRYLMRFSWEDEPETKAEILSEEQWEELDKKYLK